MEVGAFSPNPVETLRPSAGGDSTENKYYDGSLKEPDVTKNYLQVDDIDEGDGDATRVQNGLDDTWQLDLYNLANSDPAHHEETINRVTIYMRLKTGVLGEEVAYGKIAIKTEGAIHRDEQKTSAGAYALFSKEYALNPETGLAWTWTQVDALQAGVDTYVTTTKNSESKCTQVYVIVTYGVSSPTVTTQDATGVGATAGTVHSNITSVGGEDADERGFDYGVRWLTPDGVDDPDSKWGVAPLDEANLIDDDTYTWCANKEEPYDEYGSYVEFLLNTAFPVTGFRVYIPVMAEVCKKLSVDFWYDGDWHNVHENVNMDTIGWYEITGLAEHSVTKARVKIASEIVTVTPYLGEFDFYVVPASWTESNSYGTGPFEHEVTELETGYTYYFRGKAHNSLGWGYGDWKEFTTEVVVEVELGAFYHQINPLGVNIYGGWEE